MMLRDSMRDGLIHVHGDGSVWRPWLALEDAVAAYEHALRLLPGIYNAAGGNQRIEDVAELIAAEAVTGCPKHVKIRRGCPGSDGRNYRVTSAKLAATGWAPHRTIEMFAREFFENPPSIEEMMSPAWYNLGRPT
jgi:nucleoside-diphosphate-sugar epimerase